MYTKSSYTDTRDMALKAYHFWDYSAFTAITMLNACTFLHELYYVLKFVHSDAVYKSTRYER